MNLAMSQVMARRELLGRSGTFDGGVNDLPTRKKIFYVDSGTREDVLSAAVGRSIRLESIFLPETRNYLSRWTFIESYRGILILLMQKHLEFQIVTPRTLAELPWADAGAAGCARAERQREEVAEGICGAGGRVVITGTDATGAPEIGECRAIFRVIRVRRTARHWRKISSMHRRNRSKDFLESCAGRRCGADQGWNQVATSIARTSDGHVNVFFANFAGLRGAKIRCRRRKTGVEVTLNV